MPNSILLSSTKASAIQQIKNLISSNKNYFTQATHSYSAHITDFSQREEGIKLQLAFRYTFWSTVLFSGLPICLNLATMLARQCGVDWYSFTERQKANLILNHAWFSKVDQFIENNIYTFKTVLGILKVGDALLFSGLGGYLTPVEEVERLHQYNVLSSKVSTVLSIVAVAQVILYDLIWISVKKKLAKSSGHCIDIERAMSVESQNSVGGYSQASYLDTNRVWTENECQRQHSCKARTRNATLGDNGRSISTFSRNDSVPETCSTDVSDDEMPRIITGDLTNQGVIIVERRNIEGFEIVAYKTCYQFPNRLRRRVSLS